MKYILDTNIVSAVMKADPNVLARLESIQKTDVAVPQPVMSEIYYGLQRLPQSKRKFRLEERFQQLSKVLPRIEWNDRVSEVFGGIKARLEKQGTILEDFDIAIAAHAVAHEVFLITANISQMRRINGLRIENWMVS
jgi:tRNA(fMet)-specific endonuclease VapC